MKNSKTNTNGLQYLPFEDNIAQLDGKIAELKLQSEKDGTDNAAAIRRLQREQTAELKKLYSNCCLLIQFQERMSSRWPGTSCGC